jgi:GNAT superfamily N-acetyltransferase
MPILNTSASETGAAIGWVPLPWDSEQFGFAAARLEIAPGAFGEGADTHGFERGVDEALLSCRSAGIRHLTARVDIAELGAIHALQTAGFELLDGIQTMERPVGEDGMGSDVRVRVRRARPGDEDEVLAIAESAFVHDRFHADASLAPGVADRVHRAWARNCCRGSEADVVLVADGAGTIAGFVTCKLASGSNNGVIGLVATRAGARRTGAGRAMTMRALEWFRDRGAVRATVGTQLANIAAARLYQSCGFRTQAVSLTFRRVL